MFSLDYEAAEGFSWSDELLQDLDSLLPTSRETQKHPIPYTSPPTLSPDTRTLLSNDISCGSGAIEPGVRPDL